MLSEIKLIADIAKALKIPSRVAAYGLTIILTIVATLAARAIFIDKMQKIETVPALEMKIDNLAIKIDTIINRNKSEHEAIRSSLTSFDSNVKHISEGIRQKNRIDSIKFSKIQVLKENDYFRVLDEWYNANFQKLLPSVQKKTQDLNSDLTQLN